MDQPSAASHEPGSRREGPGGGGRGRPLRIGVDIDDVLVESLPEYLRRFCQRFGYALCAEEAAWEIFRRYPEISPAQVSGFFSELEATEFLATRPAYPDAVRGVRRLADLGHALYVVTGRLHEHRRHTERLLAREGLRGAFRGIAHRGSAEAAVEYKPRIVRERRLDLLIDDELHVAAAVAAVPAPVLLLDRPWNRGDVPAGVTRVQGWPQILSLVAAMADGRSGHAAPAPPSAGRRRKR
jgi:uncharacterized HAD superfamily protein